MVIRKEGSKYTVYSEKHHRRMGTYSTRAEAQKRLKQVEFFKHLKKSPGMKRKLRKKSLLKK